MRNVASFARHRARHVESYSAKHALLVLTVSLAGCGRYEFDATLDAAATPPTTVIEMQDCIPIACGGMSFQLCPALDSWSGALAACTTAGNSFARVDTASSTLCVGTGMAAAGIDTAWIGLVQTPGQPAPNVGWTWASSAEPATVFWMPGEPGDGDTVENDQQDCGFINAPNGLASDIDCTGRYAYLCGPS